MLLQPPQSVGESHRHVDGLSVEVLCEATGARHVRRHELTLHAHADGVNRPPPWDWLRQVVDDDLDESLCYRCIDHVPLHYGRTAEGAVGAPGALALSIEFSSCLRQHVTFDRRSDM